MCNSSITIHTITFLLFYWNIVYSYTIISYSNKNFKFRSLHRVSNQNDYMIQDQCILVDENDNNIGKISKYDAHRFDHNSSCPLHRAFSIFVFNQNNQLLLQQRAAEKITFPNVWSNTCCSHPLYGYIPNEVDSSLDISNGNVIGIKYAAQRKLAHELGIDKRFIPIDDMKYLTRIQYCSRDINTYGNDAIWGEHEIDYILFSRVSNDIVIQPNSDEVQNYVWADIDLFYKMIDPKSGLIWSPWFRIIADRLLEQWWTNLDEVLNTEKYNNYNEIYRF